ncbi:MAG: hypothetical protein KDI71_22805, partial [Xanthomonadales bacterium]|nr:hypothetical protein [Xanthomonadales bacterium]
TRALLLHCANSDSFRPMNSRIRPVAQARIASAGDRNRLPTTLLSASIIAALLLLLLRIGGAG